MSNLSDLDIITSADILNKDIASLPDVPELSATDLKAKFDSLSKLVIIPKVNELVTRANALLSEIDNLATIAQMQGLVTEEQILSWEEAASRAEVLGYNNAGAHNSIYRGKYLGDAVTNSQWNAIAAGTFEGLYVGDYWTIGSVNYRVAALDYWYGYGSPASETHHVVLVPDTCLAINVKMNNASTTAGAYYGCDFRSGTNSNTGKAQCETAINAAFGSGHVLSHYEYLKNAVTDNYESAGAWYESTVELMTEQMVYGSRHFSNALNGTETPAIFTNSHTQLPLFFYDHSRICISSHYWLRDVCSNKQFARVDTYGMCAASAATNAFGIRPVFGICA